MKVGFVIKYPVGLAVAEVVEERAPLLREGDFSTAGLDVSPSTIAALGGRSAPGNFDRGADITFGDPVSTHHELHHRIGEHLRERRLRPRMTERIQSGNLPLSILSMSCIFGRSWPDWPKLPRSFNGLRRCFGVTQTYY
ncbi:hypothetical protein [Aliidongia dinghuensis]|uniref:hypothetical protein n=1 Tax=Aliidongia dinghuensis TaxID=1867774 RepID=UPI00166783B2|nr:hypothetical protein [Aliidongia dinghuensis]